MELSEIIKAAFEKAFPGEDFSFVRVLPATDPKFGDYQCNDALKVAKKLHANPREIGAKVAAALAACLQAKACAALPYAAYCVFFAPQFLLALPSVNARLKRKLQ